MRVKPLLIFGLALGLSVMSWAADTPFTQTKLEKNKFEKTAAIPLKFDRLPSSTQKKVAQNFHMSVKEYRHYLYDIRYTPDRFMFNTQKLNPFVVLAMHTQNNTLRRHYIREAVKIEYPEAKNMLEVQKAMSAMVHQMHPNMTLIQTKQSRLMGLQAGDVIQLFCHINNSNCSNLLSKIKPQVLHTVGTRLDIFAVGKVTTKQIVAFGKQNHITPGEVASRKITLNFGNDAYVLLNQDAHQHLVLPQVIVRRHGQETSVNLFAHSSAGVITP